MTEINRFLKAKIHTHDGAKYDVSFPKSDNNFRFFPALSKIIGTTTQSIIKLTVDSIILPKALLKQDIMNKFFTLTAKMVVGDVEVRVCELEVKFKVSNNAYNAHNIKPVDDDLLIEIAPLQIEIPAYQQINLKELTDE